MGEKVAEDEKKYDLKIEGIVQKRYSRETPRAPRFLASGSVGAILTPKTEGIVPKRYSREDKKSPDRLRKTCQDVGWVIITD